MLRVLKAVTAIALVVLLAITTSACQSTGWGDKQMGGTLLGAGLGGLGGSQIGSGKGQLAAVAIGTLLGAWGGNQVGVSLDRADQMEADRAGLRALQYPQVGTPSTWYGPASGNRGTVTTTQEFRSASGQYCREYQHDAIVNNKHQQVFGKACLMPDGTWQAQ